MIHPVRSALVFGAALLATNIAPAQAGSNSESLVTAATVSLLPLAVEELLDPSDRPHLADPAVEDSLPPADQPEAPAAEAEPAVKPGADLTELVSAHRGTDPGNRELECLATGIYFESKGEPLAGQLAVGQVIAN